MGGRFYAAASLTILVAAWTTALEAQTPVSEPAVLYEEDENPAGKRFDGSAVWSVEPMSPAPRDGAIRAIVTIPERALSMTWLLQRSSYDASLPLHTISLTFRLPKQF